MRNNAKGARVLKLLLEHGANATEACMKFAARHELMGLAYVKLLIEHDGKSNDQVLEKAMRNRTHGVGILKLLLEHDASVTEACMKFAAGLELIDKVDEKILDEHGHKRNFEPSSLCSQRRNLPLLISPRVPRRIHRATEPRVSQTPSRARRQSQRTCHGSSCRQREMRAAVLRNSSLPWRSNNGRCHGIRSI